MQKTRDETLRAEALLELTSCRQIAYLDLQNDEDRGGVIVVNHLG